MIAMNDLILTYRDFTIHIPWWASFMLIAVLQGANLVDLVPVLVGMGFRKSEAKREPKPRIEPHPLQRSTSATTKSKQRGLHAHNP
jgi:hypothetical protein